MTGQASDILGQAGEDEFRSLCSRSGLIMTRTDVDRCGWDFRAEWRSDDGRLTDTARPRRAAFIQIKSVFEGARTFSVRLGAANDLIRTLEPSFLFVLVFSRRNELREVRGAHTFGPIASEILRRVRKKASGGADASQVLASFQISKWTEVVANTPADINRFMSDHIGDEMGDYCDRKRAFLDSTGFDDARIVVKAKLYGSEEDVIDALLGDKSILGEVVSASESRFSIPLPLPGLRDIFGEFEFSPEASSKIVAKFTGVDRRTKFKFAGSEFRLPAIFSSITDKTKMDFGFFILYVINKADSSRLAFKTKSESFRSIRTSAVEWEKFYSFLDYVAHNLMNFQIVRKPITDGEWRGTVGPEPAIAEKFNAPRAARVFNLVQRMLTDCGSPGLEFSILDIAPSEHVLDTIAESLRQPGPPFLNLSVDQLELPVLKSKVVLIICFKLADMRVALTIQSECIESRSDEGRDYFRFQNTEYVRAEVVEDMDELDSIGALIAEASDKHDVIMLPQDAFE